jgi:DNA-directed RNA polymerase specialized sigma24 family protein
LARKTLAGRPQQVADADDAVQSAFISFWRRAERGELAELQSREELWSLLGLITVRKAVQHAQKELAQKRGGGRVHGESSAAADSPEPLRLDNLLAPGARGVIQSLPAHEFDLTCEEMLLALDDEMRGIALYKLMGHTTAEIAERLGCTTRKIERKTALIRDIWKERNPA